MRFIFKVIRRYYFNVNVSPDESIGHLTLKYFKWNKIFSSVTLCSSFRFIICISCQVVNTFKSNLRGKGGGKCDFVVIHYRILIEQFIHLAERNTVSNISPRNTFWKPLVSETDKCRSPHYFMISIGFTDKPIFNTM